MISWRIYLIVAHLFKTFSYIVTYFFSIIVAVPFKTFGRWQGGGEGELKEVTLSL